MVRLTAGLMLLTVLAGCAPEFSDKAKHGIVFYVPGAGNIDFGDAGLREGLEAAGYKGEVQTYVWTISFNPALDQTLRINARLRAGGLADRIREYQDRFPGRPITLVGLSAGSGVSVWALEDLKAPYKVDNVVLLGSSLWYKYDVGKALERVRGKIYVYYSPHDQILAGPMKIFGTIDGVFGEDGAGSVGLQSPRGRDRIVNIAWRPEYERYGYVGGHVDATSAPFVRAYISRHVLDERSDAPASVARLWPEPGERMVPLGRRSRQLGQAE